MEIDEKHVPIRVQSLCITRWTIIEKDNLTKMNLGSEENLQQVKISADLEPIIDNQITKGVQRHFCLDLQRFERDTT
jgi:hypothetical protein